MVAYGTTMKSGFQIEILFNNISCPLSESNLIVIVVIMKVQSLA